MTRVKIFLAVFLISLSPLGLALELPKSPDNFSWVEAEEIKGAFLRPNGWHFKKAKQGDVQGYFITKEDIEVSGNFVTGTTINVATAIPKKTGKSASEFAYSYIGQAADSGSIQKRPWNRSMGPFNSYGVVTLNRDRKSGDYITHHLAIANGQTGTVYLVVFESPSDEWESAWAIGEEILSKLYIDSDI
jgi:hypothetical protein